MLCRPSSGILFVRHNEPRLVGHDDCLGAVAEAEFHEDPADVALRCLWGDNQGLADLGVREAMGDQPKYLVRMRTLGRRSSVNGPRI